MGNEASMEGEAQAGQAASAVPSAGAPASISAPADSGQLSKPSNGAPAGGSGAAPGPGINRAPPSDPGPKAAAQSDHQGTGDRLASHGTTDQKSRMSLQVDAAGSRTGRSPSASPHGSAPSSPYSVPQIAPMPSSKLCPVCKTTDLMGDGDNKSAANTCTQCRSMVCSQCGFNPNPHLTEVQEWLCLNCQMQRALGMDMTTPRSKSQQQLHSPSQAAKSDVPMHPAPQQQPPPQTQTQPSPRPQQQQQQQPPPQQQQMRPPTSMAKAPSQPDLSRNSPAHQPRAPRQDQTRSAGSSPSRQPPPPEQTFGKLFGFGASLLNSASNLISETIETIEPQQPQPPKPAPKPSPSTGALAGKAPGPQQAPRGPSQQQQPQQQQQQQQQIPPLEPKAKVCCPLCKTALNVGSTAEAPNYNTCTQCHAQVCNMCGFNPMPHLVEKKEWLCLNCQTQRALSGSLGDPTPVPQPAGSPRHSAPVTQQIPVQQRSNQASGLRPTGPQQQKTPGHQVSPPQTKGSNPPSPQSKPTLQPKPSSQLPAQSKGTTQPLTQSKTPGQAKAQPASQGKAQGPTKSQMKTPTQASGAKASPTSGKAVSQTKTSTAPTKTTSATSKTTSNNQARKPPPSQEKTKTSTKSPKEDVKTLPKKIVTEPVTSPKDTTIDEDTQKSRHQDFTKSSTQSLSDTGYSSDGISGSLGEITGQIHEEGIKLNTSVPSDITKLESSMKPLLEPELKNRPHSLSVGNYSPEDDAARDESEDDLSCKLRHDYVEDSSESGLSPLPIRQKKSHKDLTDEEYMRRQIMEMSADEDEMEEYGTQKTKKTHKNNGDQGKERRRLSHQSNSFEDDPKVAEARTEEDGLLAQGGLRRFKTIELNNTNSYNRDIELSTEHDLREPELEMESLTGTPEERSKGDYSSTLPATTPSYTSGTSPTSVSSMEDDSDSSPSRRARLEEAKQQRKARHRSHGPLLPTIEDSSEEDELREEEELLREQEQMRDLEQQRIRSTARKAKRDKEELRAQRRRERSKTPPSNLSPIEDASPTEELRQAAEMEELHRSSCSEYSPTMDSEAEGCEGIAGKVYKSGNEYNLPTLTTLYSPTEINSTLLSSDKTLKSADEVYEEMMRKAQIMQRQGHTAPKKGSETKSTLEPDGALTPGSSPTQIPAPVSFSSTDPRITAAQHLSKETQNRMMTQSAKIEGVVGVSTTKVQPATTRQGCQQRPVQTSAEPASSSLSSKVFSLFKSPSPPVSPSTSPVQSPTHGPCVRPSGGRQLPSLPGGPIAVATQSTQKAMSPRLARQHSSQDSPVIVITLASETTGTAKPQTVNSSTSPLSSPTQANYKTLYSSNLPPASSTKQSVNVGISTVNAQESASLEKNNNIACSSGSNVVDLRAPMRSAPIIMTDQGMDLTSLASDTRRYSGGVDQTSSRHTAVQPLIMNLNAQEQPHVSVSTPTTVSVTVAGVVFMSPAKTPVIYGDPLQNRVDLGQGVGSAVCLSQSKPPITDPSIPKIDACLENLGLQQQQLQIQQQKLLQQQQLLEQQLQQHQQQTSYARYNLANQVPATIIKKDPVVNQTSSAQPVVTASAIARPIISHSVPGAVTSVPQDTYGGMALELKNKPTAMNLSSGKPHVMMVQIDDSGMSQNNTVTQIVKQEEPPPQVLDLTGQLKAENQSACCDVVYKLPFTGSCSRPFGQNKADNNPTTEASQISNPPPPHLSVGQQQRQEQVSKSVTDEHKTYQPTVLAMGRIQPSMSDTNLPSMMDETQFHSRVVQGGTAVDLSGINQAYEIGMGAQYGSYTDLRQDYPSSNLPLRRYGSLSNISSDYNYNVQNLSGSQDSNLAQYSATTAREISRMCAALNTADHVGRYRPTMELVPYGGGRGGSLGRLNLQQSLASIRASLLYGPDGRPPQNSQALTNLINARQASLRAMYPAAIRGGDGMMYSTINTPIASTLPITTQPASAIFPVPGGVYRPYPTGVTAVSLASLTRLSQVTPRMPHPTQGQYYNNQFPPSGNPALLSSGPQETPMYLGKPLMTDTDKTNASVVPALPAAVGSLHRVSTPGLAQTDQQATHLPSAAAILAQGSIQQVQTEPLSLTQALVPVQQGSQSQTAVNEASTSKLSPPAEIPKGQEDDKMSQQQEHILQVERERVELEKMRQLRLHEELERDRIELQKHREKEQLLVQREIQELQTIKQQVLQQQQAERETQLIMQREQLAQQRMQLEQIQSLQQQLQQQLEEQKRQKTAAVEAAAAAAAAEAAAASAAAAAATSAQGALQGSPHGFIICDHTGRVIQQEGQSVQLWQDGQVVQAVVAARPIQSSASEMSLKSSDKQVDTKLMRKQNSMPRLRDSAEEDSVKKITDSCVQTDDEEGEDRFMNRRRRTRRIADCSVQTDEEDQGEWDQQPVRRRRSRTSKHSESGESKMDGSSKVSSSIAIQTTNDSSCQTEVDQLGRVSPAIHITMAETSKVDLLHYIAAPERTRKGESLACQTEPESQSHVVVAPQLSVPTTVSPYSTSLHIVGANIDAGSPRQQGVASFERRKPDPLDISYQQHDSRQPPKSPQVLYSPVSPLSPHRMLETTFASQEKLNKAHVTPQQKAFTAESPQRHQPLPRPIKSVQRSMSDPKPLSPTSEDPVKGRFSPYQQQALSNNQMAALQQQQNALMRKVKRTLPSPPPEETPLPIVTPAHMYSSPVMSQRVLPRSSQGVTKAGLLNELKAVEQESSKLRKQQAELEEEEKEIDAKLRCLELGITQRKETMVKERERRELAYLRCMGDVRDYMSDSELNNLRMAAATGTYDANGILTRPNTAPLSQFTNDPNATSQYPPSSSYMSYPYPQSQSSVQPPASAYGFQTQPYPTSAPQPGTFQPHPPTGPMYPNQASYPTRGYGQSSYQTDLGMQQHSHQGFHPTGQPMPGQSVPYPSSSYQPALPYQPQADILTVHQRPRQTSLADLEQKLPTNYEVISNPAVSVATSAPDPNYGTMYSNTYGQYRPPEPGLTHSNDSAINTYGTDGVYTSNLEQNVPRNYVMIDDISELTKGNTGQTTDAQGHPRYRNENGPMPGSAYGRPEEETLDAYGRTSATGGYQSTADSRTSTTVSGGSSYYYDDYKHGTRSSSGSHKTTPKNLTPGFSSKRSKHRKQGMEQKISKFSPIEEARDVESDLASYTMTSSTGGSCTVVTRSKKNQEDATYGKRHSYDHQKYYGTSREGLEEEDHLYTSGRSRSTGYGMDKISSRDGTGHRSKSYERDAMERSQRSSRGGRPPMRNQNSEEESPLSPVGKPVGISRSSAAADAYDARNQYGSSHSLPDVQDHHKKDLPRSHVYKPDDPYLVDDMTCAVSDSEAYHLGQEETDWFEKPREARSKHHGSSGHTSTGRRSKHTHHDYDEPPEEYGPDDYNQQRHSSREHRHHGSSSGRHSSSRHSSEDPRSSRSSRTHSKDPSTGGKSSSGVQRRAHPDPRTSQGSPRNSGDFSRDSPTGHHHGRSQRTQGERPSTRRQDPNAPGPKDPQPQQPTPGQQRTGGQGPAGRHPGSEPVDGAQQPQQSIQQQQPPVQQGQTNTTAGPAASQQPKPASTQGRQPGTAPAAGPPAPTVTKMDATPPTSGIGSKAMMGPPAPQPSKTATPPLTGIGSKAAPVGIGSKPGGIGSAAAGQVPAEGENVLTKILQGGAAEQAGKLGDALSGLGKKFTSFW